MGWEQLAPAVQAAFDTYWRRKEATKGREHEKEVLGQQLSHDKLMRELDRIQQKFIADRAHELTQQGMADDKALKEAQMELDQTIEENRIKQRNVELGEAAMAMREERTWKAGQEREKRDWEDIRTKEEQAYLDIAREDIQAHEKELRAIPTRHETIGAGAGAGAGFSTGGIADEIMNRANEAKVLFDMGWEDFSKVFPRLLSKERYDTLKTMGKDKDITDYLTAEIAKQYIMIHGADARRAGINLPQELNYFLELDDKYIQTLQSEYAAISAEQAQTEQTKKEIGRSPEAWREYRLGPSPLRGEKGETFERLREAMERGKEGVDPYLERFMDIAEKAKEGVEGIFPSIFPWARADEEKKKKKKKKK